jgi:hypothetical protein
MRTTRKKREKILRFFNRENLMIYCSMTKRKISRNKNLEKNLKINLTKYFCEVIPKNLEIFFLRFT